MQTEKKSFPGAGRFDPLNSTYKHEIHLQNGKLFTGYSKGLFYSEPADKTVALERVITRLVRAGYLRPERVKHIDFFYNKPLNGNDELFLTLFPGMYQLGKHKDIVADERIFYFLKTLYTQLQKGEIITTKLQHKPVLSSEEIIFDVRKKRFQNDAELHEFIHKQMKNGHPEGMVMNFYIKYRERWFSNPNN